MPDALAAFQRLGLQLPLAEAYPFRGVRFLSRSWSTDARFPAGRFGLGVRRTVLHRAMTERAAQVGAELLWGRVVTGIAADGIRIGKDWVRARWIVGADGSNSRVRCWAGLDASYRPRLRYAFRSHYHLAPWSDHIEVHWGERCQGYATAVSGEQVCVVIASDDPKLRLEDGLKDLPSLRERLENAPTVSSERGAITGNRRLQRVCRGRVALIGDAAGTVDVITAGGLRLAFSQALALAECMQAGDLTPYQEIHDRLTLRPRLMARLMLMLDGRPRLQDRTLAVFQKHPEIFRRLLALHVGGATSAGTGLGQSCSGMAIDYR
jgi:flavin-dependent dehydrogenase